MFFDHDANLGFSCELMAFSTKNKINTIFRCILICFVFLNLIMFGYLLHKIRKCVYQVQHTHTPQVPQRLSRVVRKIALLVGIFLAAYFPFMVIYTFPVFDMTSQLGRNIYTFTASLVLLNSACNPVLYVWRFSEPRYHMKNCCVAGTNNGWGQSTKSIIKSLLLMIFIQGESRGKYWLNFNVFK